ncbi:MAG: heme-dependent oxidative N-demethylase subunit alpha family protein [Oceanicaulis sp.]
MRSPPHVPFRAGPPGFAPALSPIDPARRFDPDTEDHVLGWKAGLLDRPEHVYRAAPESADAATEAARLVETDLGAPVTGDLLAASRLVSDDLVVMERRGEDWICTALTLTAPTFFSVDHAFRGGLGALHGPVPDGERLARRIGRVFDGLRDGLCLERFNWTLQLDAERHTPDAAPLREAAGSLDPDAAADRLHLRVERQTITRLQGSGAVLFTIRVCLDPVDALAPDDRAALAAAWRGLGAEGRRYKGWASYERAAEALFNRWGV